jgi:tripartite-type tricarboxylate transporter receptor subunit TctC
MTGRAVLSAAILALSLFLVHPGHAQPYPARPVKIIVPTVAGGTVDVITRLIANDLSSRLGVSFFVDNRSGAGNTLGSREAAQRPRRLHPADEQRQRSGHQPAGLQGHRL